MMNETFAEDKTIIFGFVYNFDEVILNEYGTRKKGVYQGKHRNN